MSTVAGWGWRQRLRHRHFLHMWHLRLNDWTVECTGCGATKPDPDIYKENHPMALVSRVWKAVAAGISAGLAAWGVAEQAGSVETGQLVAIVLAALGVALTTYLAPANVEA